MKTAGPRVTLALLAAVAAGCSDAAVPEADVVFTGQFAAVGKAEVAGVAVRGEAWADPGCASGEPLAVRRTRSDAAGRYTFSLPVPRGATVCVQAVPEGEASGWSTLRVAYQRPPVIEIGEVIVLGTHQFRIVIPRPQP